MSNGMHAGRLLALFLLLTLLVVACGGGAVEPASAPTTATAVPATKEAVDDSEVEPTAEVVDVEREADVLDLGNLTYTGVLPDRPVTLADGLAPYEDEGGGQPYVELIDTLMATGDLNGDGAEDAAAFLVDYTTGSADFVYLVAVLDVQPEPVPLEAFLIGDRTPVKSMTLADSQVIVETFASGPEDAACCPSQLVRLVFALEDGRLVETGREELGSVSAADLNGTGWQLVDFNLDQEPRLPETEITLRIEDGQISGSAGCNTYTTKLLTSEEDLPQTFVTGPIAATRMACEEPVMNQETRYLERLGSAVAWRYAFGLLSLTYELDGAVLGELLFAPTAAPTAATGIPPTKGPADVAPRGETETGTLHADEGTMIFSFASLQYRER